MIKIQSTFLYKKGFTLIELLIGIAIIGLLASIVVRSLDASRVKSRDANRASQTQEFLKAFELYYSVNGAYPTDGAVGYVGSITFTQASAPGTALIGSGYIGSIPADPGYDVIEGYRYCSTDNNKTMYLLVNTEQDGSGSNYCIVSRGPQAYLSGICTHGASDVSNFDKCANRF